MWLLFQVLLSTIVVRLPIPENSHLMSREYSLTTENGQTEEIFQLNPLELSKHQAPLLELKWQSYPTCYLIPIIPPAHHSSVFMCVLPKPVVCLSKIVENVARSIVTIGCKDNAGRTVGVGGHPCAMNGEQNQENAYHSNHDVPNTDSDSTWIQFLKINLISNWIPNQTETEFNYMLPFFTKNWPLATIFLKDRKTGLIFWERGRGNWHTVW